MILLLLGGMSLFFILLVVGYYFYKTSYSETNEVEKEDDLEVDDDDLEVDDDDLEVDDDLQNIDKSGDNAVGQSDIQVDTENDDADNTNVDNERSEYTGGGLEEAPPMPNEEEPEEDDSSQLCNASLCTGGKVLKSSTIKGNTEDKCCRDKFCSEDWDPAKGNGDPCRQFGMQYNRNSQWNGNTKEQCCKVDTTSYSKWCVQRVARKPDGTFEKTRSPIPYTGGHGFQPNAYSGTPHLKNWERAHWDGHLDSEHNWDRNGLKVSYVVADVADWTHHTRLSSIKNGKTELSPVNWL